MKLTDVTNKKSAIVFLEYCTNTYIVEHFDKIDSQNYCQLSQFLHIKIFEWRKTQEELKKNTHLNDVEVNIYISLIYLLEVAPTYYFDLFEKAGVDSLLMHRNKKVVV